MPVIQKAPLADDIVGKVMSKDLLGCDGLPATAIKAFNMTSFCASAKRDGHEAIFAYGRDRQGLFVVQLRGESINGCKDSYWHVAHLRREPLPKNFSEMCRDVWGIEANDLAGFIVKNAPMSESRG